MRPVVCKSEVDIYIENILTISVQILISSHCIYGVKRILLTQLAYNQLNIVCVCVSNLLFFVFEHFCKGQEVLNEEHDVDSPQCSQSYPNRLKGVFTVAMVTMLQVLTGSMTVLVVTLRLTDR